MQQLAEAVISKHYYIPSLLFTIIKKAVAIICGGSRVEFWH